MIGRTFLGWAWLVAGLATGWLHAAGPRPHIVVFLSDDHTWRDSSVYGSAEAPTPNMARLAAAGMTFDRAFVVSPSCAPSRAALLTGMYPARNGAEPNHSRPRADIRKLPAYLQQLGYQVVAFGKVGHYKQTAEYGFDISRHNGYHEDIAIPKALEWLEARDDPRPLCLFVGTNWPHVPWPEKADSVDPSQIRVPPHHVDTEETRRWRARYLEAVAIMDRELGQVYDLARKKLGDNVLFIHTSDHGAQWPFGKWNLYEDGIRTPLIVSWPGRIRPGTRSQAMVSWIDILPTIVEAAGGQAPQEIDGRSFLPVLEGKTDTHRSLIFTTHSGDGTFNVFPMRSVRTADGWKYIRNLHPEFLYATHITRSTGSGEYWPSWLDRARTDAEARRLVRHYLRRPAEELYATAHDAFEQRNLIDDESQRSRLESLRRQLDHWLRETGDRLAVYGTPQQVPSGDRPNFVVVFIDDMGWSDLGCYGGTTPTPHLDRLAKEGLRFQQFYVNSPICSPSRVALTTGQYPQRWRITSYLDNRRRNRERQMANWLLPRAPVLARQLRQAGYLTGHFGKWHMGGQRDVGKAPPIVRYGFDRSLTNFEGLGPRVLPLKDAYDGRTPQKHDLGSAKLGKGPIYWEDRSQVTTAFVKEAIRLIDHAEVTGQPFYINVWPDDVHSPFFPPRDLRAQTDGSKKSLYQAVLQAMDRQLGPLFDRIRSDSRLRERTIILVMSDNGPEAGAGSSAPLRGGKTWLYEGGVRSPLIVWAPGFMNPDAIGTVNATSVLCALDINRSLYSLADVPLPKARLDGEDLSATLLGRASDSRQTPIFWSRPPDRPGVPERPNPDLAVRAGRWKFYVHENEGRVELYDLEADVRETRDVADEHPEVVKRLRRAIESWRREIGTPLGIK